MSGGLAPSKSTVYASNLPFSLTNNDLHKIFDEFGKVVKVTVVKHRQTHKSTGVAFILYLNREDANKCVKEQNEKQLMGRTIKCSIAKDNGRATEFIHRKSYEDKSFCYECKEEGHLSYTCPKNALGEREPPKKKERKRNKGKAKSGLSDTQKAFFDASDSDEDEVSKPKKKVAHNKSFIEEEEGQDEEDISDEETLSSAIKKEQAEVERRNQLANAQSDAASSSTATSGKQRIRPSSYFSDEEELSD